MYNILMITIISALVGAITSGVINLIFRKIDSKKEVKKESRLLKLEEQQSILKNQESFHQAMVIELNFSKEGMLLPVFGQDNLTYELKSVEATYVSGAIRYTRVFCVDSVGNFLLLAKTEFPVEKILEMQKNYNPVGLHRRMAGSIMPSKATKSHLFATEFLEFEDYQGNSEMYMIIRVFNLSSKKVEKQFIFDKYCLIYQNQDVIVVNQTILSDNLEGLNKDMYMFIKSQISIYKKLIQQIESLK